MTYTRTRTLLIVLFIAAVAAAVFYGGCRKLDVAVVVDADEIRRYIAESDDAIELFRRDNLIPEDPYEIPGDTDAVYTDHIDSVKRTIEVFIPADYWSGEYDRDLSQDFGPPVYLSKDAEATVVDRFFVRTVRVKGVETAEWSRERSVTRYGYFLKLGDDNQAFVGWKLMGFNGGGPFPLTRVDVVGADSSVFVGDSVTYRYKESLLVDDNVYPWDTIAGIHTEQTYLDLSGTYQIARIGDGEKLEFRIVEHVDSTVCFTVAGETDNGFVNETLFENADEVFTAQLDTPDDNSRPWNIVHLQEFRRYWRDTTTVPEISAMRIKSWCWPYRVEP